MTRSKTILAEADGNLTAQILEVQVERAVAVGSVQAVVRWTQKSGIFVPVPLILKYSDLGVMGLCNHFKGTVFPHAWTRWDLGLELS